MMKCYLADEFNLLIVRIINKRWTEPVGLVLSKPPGYVDVELWIDT